MKRLGYFLLLVVLCSIAFLNAVDVTVGAGGQQAMIPFNFWYSYSLYETLYYPSEINHAGYITSISYYNNFPETNVNDQHIQVWLGTTALTDLSGGWIPSTQLTLAYDGNVSFPEGLNTITLPLLSPYLYSGQNLVIMTRNPYISAMIGPVYFECQTTGTNRAINYYNDVYNPDPANPPTSGSYLSHTGQFPKTTFTFSDSLLVSDLAASSLTGNYTPMAYYLSNYWVTVHNFGSASQALYEVKLFNLDNQELASAPGTTINPGEEVQIMLPWRPLQIGPATIYAKIILAGDQNSANDQTDSINIVVQETGIVPPPETTTTGRVPVDFYYRNSLFETIFPWYYYWLLPPSPKYITSIDFWPDFGDNLTDKPVKIWLGNTELSDLTGGWIPSNQLTLVYDSTASFQTGIHTTVDLQTPFLFTGGNLVMLVNRPMDNAFYSVSDVFHCYESTVNCSRKAFSDDITFDPANPPAASNSSNVYPYAGLYFSPIGSLEGNVRDNQNQPLAGASIQIIGTNLSATSDSLGHYTFPYVNAGNYQVTTSLPGYLQQTQTITITNLNTTTQDFILTHVQFVSVSGRIVNSAVPTEVIPGVTVTFIHGNSISTTTNAEGYFTFPILPANSAFTYNITATGYFPGTGTVQTAYLDLNLGDIALSEVLARPYNVMAASPNHDMFNISWHAPYTGTGEFIHWDNGNSETAINMFDNNFNPLPFEVAIRFTAADLLPYLGMSLCSVKFYANSPTTQHTIKVWTGYSIGNPGNLVVDLPVNNPVVDSWNMVGLNTPVLIEPEMELWIGLHFTASQTNPASCDEGPVHDWQGNLFNTEGGWMTLYSLIGDWVYNWNIQGILNVPATTDRNNLVALVDHDLPTVGGNLRCEPVKHHITADITTRDDSSTRSLLGYRVWRLDEGQEDNPAAWIPLNNQPITSTSITESASNLPSLGSWTVKWAVKAVYSGDNTSPVSFSNRIWGGVHAGLLYGVVTDSITNLPIAAAQINLANEMIQYDSTTDDNGYYAILAWPGTYSVNISADAYLLYEQSIVVITNGDSTLINAALTPDVHNPEQPALISATCLYGCYPNPFSSQTTIKYDLKDTGPAKLEIYNIKGQNIITLFNGVSKSGRYTVDWNGTDNYGTKVASGVYYYRLTSGGYGLTRKMVYIK